MKRIKLTKGKYALVDDEDFEYLNQFKWCFNGYAIRRVKIAKHVYKVIFIHRIVNNIPDGFEGDHINHDKLDNRRSNLRTVTHKQNTRNPGLRKNSSGTLGVSWIKDRQKWLATIATNRKTKYLGIYKHKEHAILARKWGERLYFDL